MLVTVLVNMFTTFNYTECGDCTDPLGIYLLHKNGLIFHVYGQSLCKLHGSEALQALSALTP